MAQRIDDSKKAALTDLVKKIKKKGSKTEAVLIDVATTIARASMDLESEKDDSSARR